MTTFVTRETTRDAIAALFTPYTGTGQLLETVFNNWPTPSASKGLSPFVMVVSRGSSPKFGNYDLNPVKQKIAVITMVQAESPNDTSVTRAFAMDKIDRLQALVFQVILDSAHAGNAAWDNIYFSGDTEVDTVNFGGLPYMTEVFPIEVQKLK